MANAELFRRIVNAASSNDTGTLLNCILFAIVIILADNGLNFINSLLTIVLQNKSTLNLQSQILHKLLNIEMMAFEKYHTADLIRRLTECAKGAQVGLNTNAVQLLSNVLQIVFLLTYLSFVNFTLKIGRAHV